MKGSTLPLHKGKGIVQNQKVLGQAMYLCQKTDLFSSIGAQTKMADG